MTHDEAVNIARSGEGAVVATLLFLSRTLSATQQLAEQREQRIMEMLNDETQQRGQDRDLVKGW